LTSSGGATAGLIGLRHALLEGRHQDDDLAARRLGPGLLGDVVGTLTQTSPVTSGRE
jgi:hypothetical protein